MSLSLYPIIDYFIPEKNINIAEDLRKSRIIVSIYYFLASLAMLQWISTMGIGETNNFPFWIGILILLVSLFVFKRTGSYIFVGNIIPILLFVLLVPIIIDKGALYSDDLLWLILAPLIAFLLAGRWSGVLWTVVMLATIYYMYLLENGPEGSLRDQAIMMKDSSYYLLSLITLFTAVVGIIFIFDLENKKLIKEVSKNRNALQKHNDHLEEIVKDRTKSLAESNEQLRRSNSDLEQFAYVASHDLQEPLRMVGNFVQLLEEEYYDKIDDTGKMYVKYTVDGVSRMSLLIEELLQYSRVGKRGQEIKEVDLNDILAVKRNDLDFLIKQSNVELIIGTLPSLDCIPGLISIIFHNLITNAIKFNKDEKPKVEIAAKEDGKYWKFSVKDNGIGIDTKHQSKIFEVFKRLHRKEEYSGTGIGLSICKKIVLYHHGDIWFESEGGKGTTFFFTIHKNLKKLADFEE